MSKSIFLQPFPFYGNRKAKLISASLVSTSVFFILLAFQPFGLSLLASHLIFPVILGYAVLCFLVMLFNNFFLVGLLPKFFTEDNWKVYKEILWHCYHIFSIGLANFMYSYWLGFFSISVYAILQMLLITFLVAVFPSTILTILRYNYLLHKNLHQAVALDKQLPRYQEEQAAQPLKPQKTSSAEAETRLITLPSEEKNGSLTLELSTLLYIAADDNYLEVVYTKGAKIQKSILRNTLKNIEISLGNFHEIFRCHRSYLVNLRNVKNITGNSQGYRLVFAGTDFEVPVSRTFAKELKDRMEVNS